MTQPENLAERVRGLMPHLPTTAPQPTATATPSVGVKTLQDYLAADGYEVQGSALRNLDPEGRAAVLNASRTVLDPLLDGNPANKEIERLGITRERVVVYLKSADGRASAFSLKEINIDEVNKYFANNSVPVLPIKD